MEVEITKQTLQNLKPNWVSILPIILKKYNNSTYSTIDMTPVEASHEKIKKH